MRRLLAGSFGLALGLMVAHAPAQEVQWRPAGPRVAATAQPPLAAPQQSAGAPIATLGRPEPIEPTAPASAGAPLRDNQLTPTTYQEPVPVIRGQSPDGQPPLPTLGQPVSLAQPTITTSYGVIPVVGEAPAPYGPPPVSPPPFPGGPPPGPPVFPGGPPPGGPPPGTPFMPPLPPPPAHGPGLFGCEALGCTTGARRKMFQSDHEYDDMFVSPITNPFLFLDPRSLTEVRPILIYQHAPDSNPLFKGGNLEFFGFEGSVAITDRLSFVVNKAGFVATQPQDDFGIGNHAGLSELWLGPKFTFLRLDQTVAAGGVTFQIPAGSGKVFQDTGSLTMVPYVSVAQHFLKDFNFMSSLGMALGDNSRTDYLFSSYHLDYDVGGLHRIFPMVELNWFHYTTAGSPSSPIFTGYEGRDLINFGSQGVSGTNSLTFALGARFKINTFAQTGLALEFPLIASKDLLNFRLTADFILRY